MILNEKVKAVSDNQTTQNLSNMTEQVLTTKGLDKKNDHTTNSTDVSDTNTVSTEDTGVKKVRRSERKHININTLTNNIINS